MPRQNEAVLAGILLSLVVSSVNGFISSTRPTFVSPSKLRTWSAASPDESMEERPRDATKQTPPVEFSSPESELASLRQMLPCSCRSGKYFKSCCQPFVEGGEIPTSPEEVLRARFTAYAQEKVDFIIRTTHETHPEFTLDVDGWRRELTMFIRSVEFEAFKIIDSEELEPGSKAAVTWSAEMRVLPDILRPEVVQTKAFTERSILLFDTNADGQGQWYYAGGDEDFEPTNELVRTGPKPPRPRGGGGDDRKVKAKPKVKAKATAGSRR